MPFWLKIDHSWPLLLWAWAAPELIRSSTRAAMSNCRSAGARGGGGGQWGWGNPSGQGRQPAPAAPSRSNAAHNPYEVVMPWFMEPIAETADQEDQSIIVIDKRDDRMVSPFQTWLVSEIMANAASSINVLTERDQVMPPSRVPCVALWQLHARWHQGRGT